MSGATRRDATSKRLGLALIIAAMLHGGLGVHVALTPPPAAPRIPPKKVDKYAQLKAIREKVELPKPKEPDPPPPPPKPEPEPEPEPRPEPPKDEANKPKPPPKKGKPKRARPKPKDAPPPKPEPAVEPEAPKPLQLTHVNLTGGVAVQKGDSDIFGDPSVAATKKNTRPDTPDEVGDPGGTSDGVGTAPARRKVRKLPKPLKKVKGLYPADAPRYGRTVTVVLSMTVGADGRTSNIKVVKGAGGAFDREARSVGRRQRFKPGTVDGEPSAMTVRWEVAFEPPD